MALNHLHVAVVAGGRAQVCGPKQNALAGLVKSLSSGLVLYSRRLPPTRDAAEPDLGGWGEETDSIYWKETDDLETCEGGDYVPHDPWGTGNNGKPRCPLLPRNWTAAQQVAACKEVCVAGGFGCAGFVVYGSDPPNNNTECCFRSDTSDKPKCKGHGGVGTCSSCFEKLGMDPIPGRRPPVRNASVVVEPCVHGNAAQMWSLDTHAHDSLLSIRWHGGGRTWPTAAATAATALCVTVMNSRSPDMPDVAGAQDILLKPCPTETNSGVVVGSTTTTTRTTTGANDGDTQPRPVTVDDPRAHNSAVMPPRQDEWGGQSTATSALGHMLSFGQHHGAGVHG